MSRPDRSSTGRRIGRSFALVLALATLGVVLAPGVPAPGAYAGGYGTFVSAARFTPEPIWGMCNYRMNSYVVITIDHGGLDQSGPTPWSGPTLTIATASAGVGGGTGPSDPLVRHCPQVLSARARLLGHPATGYCEIAWNNACDVKYGWQIGPIGPMTSVKHVWGGSVDQSFTADFAPTVYVN